MAYGIPFGAPFHTPAPKSIFNGSVEPIVLTQTSDIPCTGSLSIGVFQTLFGGNTSQAPSFGESAPSEATTLRAGSKRYRKLLKSLGPPKRGPEPRATRNHGEPASADRSASRA